MMETHDKYVTVQIRQSTRKKLKILAAKRRDFGTRLKAFGLQPLQMGNSRTRAWQGVTLKLQGEHE
jgi:hypothetical protein